MKKWLKYLLGILGLLGILIIVGVQQLTYQPSENAQEAAQMAVTDEYVRIFKPDQISGPNIILYQGGFVEAEAYAPLASDLTEAGFTVYLIDTPLNLAVLAEKRGLAVIEDYQLTEVIFMGHSLGGVIAARNAAASLESGNVAGLVLLASYLADSTDLSQVDFPVLSITASQDEVLNWEAYDLAVNLLPPQTIFEEIEGGNHSGFGDYGQQTKDGLASITGPNQRQQLVSFVTQVFQP